MMINADGVFVNPKISERILFSFREKIKINFIAGCWDWMGAKCTGGYGQIGSMGIRQGKNTKAHQLSWIIYNGDIPEGLWICHKCDNPSCVNPDHLFLGTPKDNAQDKYLKGRANHPTGINTGHAQLDEQKVKLIIELLGEGKSSREIRKELNLPVRARTIRQILEGKTWKQVARPESFNPKRRVNQYE